jgi:hypothetical protein
MKTMLRACCGPTASDHEGLGALNLNILSTYLKLQVRSYLRCPTRQLDVFLAMQEDKNPHRYRALRAELTKLQQENERLKQGIGKIRQQSAMDRVTIYYLSRATPSTRGMQQGSLETELEPSQNPSTGSCPPRTPYDAIEKSYIETLSEKKRKRITTDSGERSDDSETDTILYMPRPAHSAFLLTHGAV